VSVLPLALAAATTSGSALAARGLTTDRLEKLRVLLNAEEPLTVAGLLESAEVELHAGVPRPGVSVSAESNGSDTVAARIKLVLVGRFNLAGVGAEDLDTARAVRPMLVEDGVRANDDLTLVSVTRLVASLPICGQSIAADVRLEDVLVVDPIVFHAVAPTLTDSIDQRIFDRALSDDLSRIESKLDLVLRGGLSLGVVGVDVGILREERRVDEATLGEKDFRGSAVLSHLLLSLLGLVSEHSSNILVYSGPVVVP